MTKSTITRERIQRIIRAIDSEAYDEEEIREWLSSDEIMELARLALAAMDSEPVAYTDEAELNFVNDMACMWTKGMGINEVPLYRHAQPAPVVDADDNFYSWFGREWHENYQHNQYTTAAKQMLGVMAESAWKAGRRAAMLQAGALTNEDTKQTWAGIPDIDNAIIMLDRIDTQESCDDDRIEDVKAVLRRLASNSPVIPDTWIPACERMPEVGVKVLCFPVEDEPIHASFNGQLWLQDISWSVSDEIIDNVISCNVTHWMPLPAYPQEVK